MEPLAIFARVWLDIKTWAGAHANLPARARIVDPPGHVSARLVTVPGSSWIRIELEGSAALAYDPKDETLFLFGDIHRTLVDQPLLNLQAHALKAYLARYAAERRDFCLRRPCPGEGALMYAVPQ